MVQPTKDDPKVGQVLAASVARSSVLDPTLSPEALAHVELALVREFFELLADWDEGFRRGN
jgi:hypothetical protein